MVVQELVMMFREPVRVDVTEEQVEAVVSRSERVLRKHDIDKIQHKIRILGDHGGFRSSSEQSDNPIDDFENSVSEAIEIEIMGCGQDFKVFITYRSNSEVSLVDVGVFSDRRVKTCKVDKRSSIELSLVDAGFAVKQGDSEVLVQEDGEYITRLY
jgi:hypothetical protein